MRFFLFCLVVVFSIQKPKPTNTLEAISESISEKWDNLKEAKLPSKEQLVKYSWNFGLFVVLPVYALVCLTFLSLLHRELWFFRKSDEIKDTAKPEWEPFLKRNVPDMGSHIWLYLKVFVLVPIRFFFLVNLLFFAMIRFSCERRKPVSIFTSLSWWFIRVGLNIQIHTKGTHDDKVSTIISNHISMWDAFIFYAIGIKAACVANSYVSSIPVIGNGCKRMGYIFLQAKVPDSREQAAEAIKNFQVNHDKDDDVSQLLVFPEGTTTNQSGILKFRLGVFHNLVPIQPIRITYSHSQYAFVGSDGFMTCIALSLAMNGGHCTVEFLPTIYPEIEETPESYAEKARLIIAGNILPLKVGNYKDHFSLLEELVGHDK
jgi:1-acyl-sn-glycerol-3-phosphate acyltransferase